MAGRAQAEPVLLHAHRGSVDTDGYLSVLVEGVEPMSFDQVRAADQMGRFQPISGYLGAGYVSRPRWLKIEVDRSPESQGEWWLEVEPPYLDSIQLFIVGPGGSLMRMRSGDRLPFASRAVVHRNVVFPLHLPEGPSTIYLRVETTSTMIVIPKFWQPMAFAQASQREYLLWGSYFGLLFSVFLFGTLNGLVTGRRSYYAYAAYVLAQAFEAASVSGLVGEFVFPNSPELVNAAVGVGVGTGVATSALLFVWLFQMREHYPRLYRLYQVLFVSSAITALTAATDYYGHSAAVTIGLTLVAIAFTLKPAWAYVRHPASSEKRWLGCAYLMFVTVVVGNILSVSGLLAPRLIVLYGSRAAVVAFVLTMHVGLLMLVRESERRRMVALDSVRDAERGAVLERRAREERDQFLSMFNHEVRTPLSIIRASAQSLELLDREPDPQRQSRYRNILQAVDRTQKLVELCLTTDRFDTGMWVSSPVSSDLVELTRTTLSLLGTEVGQRVQLHVPAQAPVHVDPDLVRIVFLNLLDNAFKYATPDSPIVIAIVPCTSDDGTHEAAWLIENEGPVWVPGEEERLFDKYFRVSEHAGQPGLGLGLFLVRRIMQMHNGRVTAEIHGKGARFRCVFPAEAIRELAA